MSMIHTPKLAFRGVSFYKVFKHKNGKLCCGKHTFELNERVRISYSEPIWVCVRDMLSEATESGVFARIEYSDDFNRSEIKVVELLDGVIEGIRFQNGRLHNYADEALLIDGAQKRFYAGHLHNGVDDQPACIRKGTTYWYQHGNLHRESDQPAIVRADGSQEWYLNGVRHRETGPAMILADGSQHWFLHGERDRVPDTLPASEFPDGTKHYYRSGVVLGCHFPTHMIKSLFYETAQLAPNV